MTDKEYDEVIADAKKIVAIENREALLKTVIAQIKSERWYHRWFPWRLTIVRRTTTQDIINLHRNTHV